MQSGSAGIYEKGWHMVLKDLIGRLEQVAPEHLAEDWDNVGLLVGDRMQEVHKIFLALDADDAAVAQAADAGAQLLLVHHPLIFSPLRRVSCDDFIGARVVKLLRAGMSCYAMHTNFDVAQMGILSAERLGFPVEAPLADIQIIEERAYGIGVICALPEQLTVRQLCEHVKTCFGLSAVRAFGDTERVVTRAAICPGSGKSVIQDAIAAGVQVLITGDIDHHSGIDAAAQGLQIIDAGHYGIEHIFVGEMEQYLKRTLEGTDVTVVSMERRDPFTVI